MSGVDPERFARKVSPFTEGALGCRPWLGAMTDGRAITWDPATGKPIPAARVAWQIAHGVPVPPTAVVLHVCDNGLWCVEQSHLAAGTQAANLADAAAKERTALGRGIGGGRGGRSRLEQDAAERIAEALAIREKHRRLVRDRPVQVALF